ncbi:hypothetical protein POTOM_050482 [Populus tomentosa]|uniref:Uncharacterized protein n=1 Tax=Populus tomentosa TaxID=118781 RepID=A0A8X8C9H2_POPTO|nr:hypothetical protein POTOM_050482 [Populus tomentosa]
MMKLKMRRGSNSLAQAMVGATTGREKMKLTTMEQDLLPIKKLVYAGRKSTVGERGVSVGACSLLLFTAGARASEKSFARVTVVAG